MKNPIGTAQPVFKEIKALEFRDGDIPMRYYLTVPSDVVYGQTMIVDLGGRRMSVKIPDTIERGEKVIIIAPAPVEDSST